MTINVSQNNPRAAYTATAGQTAFAVPFVFYESTNLTVYKNGSVVNAADYTVSGGNGSTGTVTLDTGAVLNDEVVIVRDVPIERTTDLTSSYNASSIDDQLDRIAVQIADLNDLAGRSLKVNDWEVDPPLTLPSLNTRKGKVLGFNLSTGAMEATLNASEVGALAGITGDISALAALDTEIGALYAIRTDIDDLGSIAPAITAVNANASNVTATATNIANVNLVGASIADVNDVADSLGEISYVYNKLDNIDTVALGISNVNTVASNIAATNAVGSNIAAVTSVNASLTQVGTVHTNIANVNVVGNSIDDVNDVAVAITDVTTVSDGLANINTVAGIAGNVSTVAGISSSVSTVAGITGNIASVVSNASNISTTASGISNINSVASSISNVNTVAGNIGNVNTVALDSADISTVAGIAGFVPTLSNVSNEIFAVAGNLSKITTVNSNAASITTVANNITDVNTVAGISGSVSTVAGITGNIASVVSNAASITTVAGSITNVNTVAGEIDAVVSIQGSVSAAATSESNAATSASAASSSATTASGHATSAAASAAAAASTASGIAGFDLDAIAASKAVTATDVFVYDTSKDSDGGAWRKRTQHTSWYNETLNTATRGARKEFPAVAVIVAENDKVTIYDGDDPALPMWMVFNSGGSTETDCRMLHLNTSNKQATACFTLNGILCVSAETTGVTRINFISDKSIRSRNAGTFLFLGNISERGDALGGVDDDSQNIVNDTVNDVAMTVLPNAPIDAATGLPVPTIAVATNGGVSVIKDDGTVVDIPTSGTATNWVSFNDRHQLASEGNYDDRWVLREIPDADVANLETNDATRIAIPYRQYGAGADYQRQVSFGDTYASDLGNGKNGLLLEYGAGSALGRTSLVALLTSTYNTGWMNGDIKGAFLSSTDTASLVGANVYTSDFSVGVDGFLSNNSTISADTGRLKIVDAGSNGVAYKSFSVTAGKPYAVSFRYEYPSANVTNDYAISVRADTFTGTILTQKTTGFVEDVPTEAVLYVTPTTNTIVLVLAPSSNTGDIAFYDNISIDLADADRSVNNNGLIVNGTVTRSAVATGAELVGYSGFSASNYLEQPYNADLDFGTGDFCVMGWVKTSSGARQYIVSRYSASHFVLLRMNAGGAVQIYSSGGSSAVTTAELDDNIWHFVAGIRSNGVLQMYVDGVANGSPVANTVDITDTDATLTVGMTKNGTAYQWFGSLALLRISATAPTAEQIKKIYEDEKVLFQENAAATLYGASDAVTALAHDEDTGILSVGTSAGRSDFQGLRRVNNTTTAVGVAISAAGGMIVEE